jgi:hypothetical protein
MRSDDVWRIVVSMIVATTLAAILVNLSDKSPKHLSVNSDAVDTAQMLGRGLSNRCSVNQMFYGPTLGRAWVGSGAPSATTWAIRYPQGSGLHRGGLPLNKPDPFNSEI